ncbi:MAG: M56 family metallopeptidase [Planctomycetota bacterium]
MSGLFANNSSHPTIETLGWTLIHFTWQALIIGCTAWLVLRFIHVNLVRTRYAVCCAGLIALAIMPALTATFLTGTTSPQFAPALLSADPVIDTKIEEPLPSSLADRVAEAGASPAATGFTSKDTKQIDWTEKTQASLRPALPWLIGGWLCGVVLLAIRLAGGWFHVRRWKQAASKASDDALNETFERLRERMGIRQCVRLRESTRMMVPMVIGSIRPVVLFPTSMLTGLTPMELESILAHELAHVRRYDYLVNLLQNVLETLLFFHPVVWWLSHQTRIEREHCCDEIAIEACGDRPALALALTKIEESRHAPSLLVAANGGDLLRRVRRILQKDTRVNHWPAGAASFLAVVTLLVGIIFSSASANDEPIDDYQAPQAFAAIAEPQNDDESRGTAETAEPRKPNYALRMTQVRRNDSKTGQEKSVFTGIRMMAAGDAQVSQDMIYSNVFNYSFLSQRAADRLDAAILGEIDFLDHAPTKAERFGPKVDLFLSQVTEPVGKKIVGPYQSDTVWIPGHLGFYGMNATKQHVFKIVRLSKVDLGIGPPLRDVNMLVLDDANSDFGVIGRDLTKRLSRESGKSVLFSADGEMWLRPRTAKADDAAVSSRQRAEPAQQRSIRLIEREDGRITRAIIDANQQSVARRRYLLRVHDEIVRAQGRQPSDWSTKRETIVSARANKWSSEELESRDVTFSIPENTSLRAAFSGDHVRVQRKLDHSLVTVVAGQIDLVDDEGVIRARATAASSDHRLVVRVETESDENVLHIRAEDENQQRSNVRVRFAPDSGNLKENDLPHGGLQYKLEFPEKADDEFRMRLSIRENLDRLRRELGVETDSESPGATGKTPSLKDLLNQAPAKEQSSDSVTTEGWGPKPKSGDLRLRLSLVTEHAEVGEPLRLKLELKNFGDQPQKYDPQYYSAFRVLEVIDAKTGNLDTSLGMTYQTMGGEVALGPGETVVLWKSEDASELYMIDEGTYKIRVASPRIRSQTLPASNTINATVAAGRQTFPKRLMRALGRVVPKEWDVEIGWQQRVYLSYSPTKYKRDTVTIQLWATKEPLPESGPGDQATIGSSDEVGNLHLSASQKAQQLWPDYRKVLSDAAQDVLRE